MYQDWYKGDWAALLEDGGLDCGARKMLGSDAIARTQKVRQEKAAKASAHCGGERTALRGWCAIDSSRLHDVLGKSWQGGLFCSTKDTGLAKVHIHAGLNGV